MIFFDNQTNNTSCVAGMKGPTVVYTPDGVTRALFEVKKHHPLAESWSIKSPLQEGLSAFPAPGKVVGPTSSRWWDHCLISANLDFDCFLINQNIQFLILEDIALYLYCPSFLLQLIWKVLTVILVSPKSSKSENLSWNKVVWLRTYEQTMQVVVPSRLA